ncbi:hypothetical protein ACWDRB_62335 [Nonomuraea sp. NPDC003707]
MLRAFAERGRAPEAAELARAEAQYGVSAEQVLAELHEAGFVRLDADGQVRAAYPFSAVPTAHRVCTGCAPGAASTALTALLAAGWRCSQCARSTRSAWAPCSAVT